MTRLNTRGHYDAAYKLEIINQTNEKTVRQISIETGVPLATVSKWKYDYQKHKKFPQPKTLFDYKYEDKILALEDENEKLKKEITTLHKRLAFITHHLRLDLEILN